MSQIVPITLAGANGTGYVLDLQTIGAGTPSVGANKCGYLKASVNGTSGDFWVQPCFLADGVALPAAPSDPRPTAGNTAQWIQIKSGESVEFGTKNSKGYDPAIHGSRPATGQLPFFCGVLVYCVAAGTVTATQLRIEAA